MLFCAISPCACGDELPVVARGRFVEIATDRDEPVCAGTVAHLDALVEAGFALIGEEPPDRTFIRYEWNEEAMGFAGIREDRILVRSPLLVDEHELAHGIHLQAWPRSARFMHEGFATMLGPSRFHFQSVSASHFTTEYLDDLLADRTLEPGHYAAAWFLVSQIVHDHGFEGLRKFWHAVPHRASTQTVRQAYLDVFGEPIDVLLDDKVVEIEGQEEQFLAPRHSCFHTLCVGEAHPWEAENWRVRGPIGCEDDPKAVGASVRYDHTWSLGLVSREYLVDIPWWFNIALEDSLTAVFLSCGFHCLDERPGAPILWTPDLEQGSLTGRFRVEVRARLDDLPTDTPGTLELTLRDE